MFFSIGILVIRYIRCIRSKISKSIFSKFKIFEIFFSFYSLSLSSSLSTFLSTFLLFHYFFSFPPIFEVDIIPKPQTRVQSSNQLQFSSKMCRVFTISLNPTNRTIGFIMSFETCFSSPSYFFCSKFTPFFNVLYTVSNQIEMSFLQTSTRYNRTG